MKKNLFDDDSDDDGGDYNPAAQTDILAPTAYEPDTQANTEYQPAADEAPYEPVVESEYKPQEPVADSEYQPVDEYKPQEDEYQPVDEYKPQEEEYKPAEEEYKPAEEEYKPAEEEYKPAEEEYKPVDENGQENQPEYNAYDPQPMEESKKVDVDNQIEQKKDDGLDFTPDPEPEGEVVQAVAEGEQTSAEKELEQSTLVAKNQMVDEIKAFGGSQVDEEAQKDDEAQQDDPRVAKFTVTSPVKVQGHVKYSVTGVDFDGEFNDVRRFREFHALADVLRIRWPGCYIPSIPEKKMNQNNNDDKFVEERRELLERFMREIAKYDYIIFSKEFKVFARGKGEIDKVLYALPKQTPMQVLEKYRLNFKIDEEQDESEVLKCKENIQKFQLFLKKVITIMENQKKMLKSQVATRDKHDKNQSDLMFQLMKYEDIGLAYYSDQDYNKRILTHPNCEDLKEKVHKNLVKTKNPYRDAYIWIKGEFLDVQGMYDAIQGREGVMKALIATEQKKKDDTKNQEKLAQGKTTLKTLFKSKTQKENKILNLQAATEIADQEIIDFKLLIKFLTIYHGQSAIPKFKAGKKSVYLKALNKFCVKEISNAHLAATLYHSLLDVNNKE